MNDCQVKILRHTVGLDNGDRMYRNSYVAGPGHTNFETLKSMVESGLMEEAGTINKDNIVFAATEAGKQVARDGCLLVGAG